MGEIAPFTAQCPTCKHERLQTDYSSTELMHLLRAGANIEAYCSNCHEAWPLPGDARADLARTFAAD
jgi:hypothetical protein